ncbi:ubiquitin-associated protein 2-like isoform X2 [Xyrauchen texanus]|uniref:ubiquitin-associated protein 2-like isoform X2 n=1 Tax=Xyrauchen texanus TaxID=154827 RepID=UPI002241B791|nr:ubiquitin-associated protein 2-like isoform X2 [Xyrauchen texanus]
MMTSVGIERARGTRDKALPSTTQTTQPQKQLQATAEQIRLAQMIFDKNDADFEDKVKQLMEVTGQNQDDCMVALHDCNEDVNRAINFLLEGTSDATSWETVGKKKSLVKDGSSTESKENKENREKKGERESSKGRGGVSRRGRGTSRNRPVRTEENGVEPALVDREADRSRRGRGRVSGGRGRGRALVTSRFTAQGMGTFDPAEYTTNSGTSNSHTEVWETVANDTTDGTVAWQNTLDEWAAEDWSEDLSETKVFTSSCATPAENHITPGQSLDLSSLLQKPVDREEVGCLKAVGSTQGLGHSLVFTNSHHQPARNGATSAGSSSYTHATLSSVLGSGFGELGGPKLGQTAGQQILEQLKGPGLGQLTSQPLSTGTNCTPVGGLVGTGMSVPTSSWDIIPPGSQSSASLSSQFSREFQMQPEPSLVLSQLAQRQQGSLTHMGPLARQPSPPPLSTPSTAPGTLEAFPKAPEPPHHRDGPSMAPSQACDSQGSSTQQRQIKTQKRRIPPTSKIPSSAVEMPGSADVSGLNVQFGALDFGSESALPDFSQSENCNSEPMRESAVVPQSQSSLYSNPISESLASPVPLLLPLASSDTIYPSPSVPVPSLVPSHTNPKLVTVPTCSSSSSSAASSAGNSFDCGVTHSRLTFSQSKEPSGPVTNGFNGVRTSAALDTTSSSSTPKRESPSLVNSTSVAPSVPSSLLPPSVTPHSSSLPCPASEISSANLPPLSSHLNSGHSSVSALCTTSSLAYTSVDSVNSLAPSSMPFSLSVSAPPSNSMSSSMSGSNSLHGSGALGQGTNGIMPSGVRTTQLLSSSSGKAPNLSQGVPPLLPNQYIMGPGGLLPAYPQIYGYEDLHMLQSRVPMDYYGIAFPGPTATLSGRDGSLASNPYSGDITKFGRGESTSPAPSTSLSAAHAPQTAQPLQAQNQGQGQPQGHHNTQQTFLNAALPPGYSYTGLPYYPGMPGMPSAFQYGPTMFVPPASAKQHGMGLSNPTTPFQQPSGYGQHAFSSGYDDLTQGPAGTEYSKGYINSSQTQAKSVATGPVKGISVTSSNSGVPDISGTVYNKTPSFDKQGFHTGTPPPFNLPSALGGTGTLTPGAAPGYAPAPFLHILPPHQQPHSQLLHHHLTQDGQGGPSQRSQSSTMQQKTQVNKSNYGSSPYWGN